MKILIAALSAVAALSAGMGMSLASDNPIVERQKILKNWGDVTKQPGAVLKGEAKFDLGAAQNALKAYAADSARLIALYPDNSKTGNDTAARANIWQEKAKFEGIYKKLADEATKASTAIKDEASFKAEFGKVLGNCKACHDDYRQKKS